MFHYITNYSLLSLLTTEGVGKSSLISTFVSRHFSEVVPGIMTRVRLPPDPDNNCITTIVDSQGGDAALMSAVATMNIPGGSTAAAGTTPTAASTSRLAASPLRPGAGKIAGGSAPVKSESMASLSSLQKSLSQNTNANVGGIENVDSIILVYDLDRDETFFRLENHWLPLIERCFNGEVSSLTHSEHFGFYP